MLQEAPGEEWLLAVHLLLPFREEKAFLSSLGYDVCSFVFLFC